MPRKHKVLVADDSLTVRKMVEMLLVQEGYEVVLAESGAKCLALCASSTPDLLLLDFILPDMRGVEVCQSLMNSPNTWEIPVLLMSGNGNAIRQLYQDMNNVADYLTKPFPPNVLKAVVAHVLQKNRAGARAAGVTPTEFPPELPTQSQLGLATPSVFAGTRATHPQTDLLKATPPRAPGLASSRRETPQTVIARFRQVLQKHWRAAWQHIPAWERERGPETPETFYTNRFLAAPLWQEMSSDLLSAAGLTSDSTGAFRCPAALVPFDQVLQHLHASKATGELRVELGEETVSVLFSDGEVVFLGSNHPRQYCAGAEFGFNRLPHVTIAAAVQAQETWGIPFFITLHQTGALADGPTLEKLLREQGERAVLRAYQSPTAVTDFRPLDALPEIVAQYRLAFPVWQLLLTCYRKVDDWFTIEQVVPDLSAGLTPSLEYQTRLRQLQLNDQEKQLLESISPSRTVQQIVELSGLGSFVASQVLFRFLKLGMHFAVPHPEEPTREIIPEQPALMPSAEPLPAEQAAPLGATPEPATPELVTPEPAQESVPAQNLAEPPTAAPPEQAAAQEPSAVVAMDAPTPTQAPTPSLAQETEPGPGGVEPTPPATPEQPAADQTTPSPTQDQVAPAQESPPTETTPKLDSETVRLILTSKPDGLVSLELAYDEALTLKQEKESQKTPETENAATSDGSAEPDKAAPKDNTAGDISRQAA
jgi:CheY-like chemotaxis protein